MRKARSKRVLVSIPSEVGRGRAREHGLYPSTPRPVCFVSIPSEVGRGRARYHRIFSRDRWSSVSFQSPRRWGGVGLGVVGRVAPWSTRRLSRFNPLGGGAGSGSQSSSWPLTACATVSFQSPRRWGGVGLSNPARARWYAAHRQVSIPSEVG